MSTYMKKVVGNMEQSTDGLSATERTNARQNINLNASLFKSSDSSLKFSDVADANKSIDVTSDAYSLKSNGAIEIVTDDTEKTVTLNHYITTAADPAIKKIGQDAYGHVVIGDTITADDFMAVTYASGKKTTDGDKSLYLSNGVATEGKMILELATSNSGLTLSESKYISVNYGANLGIDSEGKLYGTYSYTLPVASSTDLGGIKIGYTESGKNYPVALDANNKAYVNVPWTDTNSTTHLYAGASKATSNSKKTNGNLYLTVADDSTASDSIKIVGTNYITVTSNATGVITIDNSYVGTAATPALVKVGSDEYGHVIIGDTFSAADLSAVTYASDAKNTSQYKSLYLADGVATEGELILAIADKSGLTLSGDGSRYISVNCGDNLAIDSTTGKLYGTYSYTLPAATSDALGGIKLGYTQSGKKYPVELDDNNCAYVNVPWSNSTTHLYVGASGAAANSAQTNGNVYLNVTDGTTARTTAVNIKGTNGTTVTCDATGVITVDSSYIDIPTHIYRSGDAWDGAPFELNTMYIYREVMPDYSLDVLQIYSDATKGFEWFPLVSDLTPKGVLLTNTTAYGRMYSSLPKHGITLFDGSDYDEGAYIQANYDANHMLINKADQLTIANGWCRYNDNDNPGFIKLCSIKSNTAWKASKAYNINFSFIVSYSTTVNVNMSMVTLALRSQTGLTSGFSSISFFEYRSTHAASALSLYAHTYVDADGYAYADIYAYTTDTGTYLGVKITPVHGSASFTLSEAIGPYTITYYGDQNENEQPEMVTVIPTPSSLYKNTTAFNTTTKCTNRESPYINTWGPDTCHGGGTSEWYYDPSELYDNLRLMTGYYASNWTCQGSALSDSAIEKLSTMTAQYLEIGNDSVTGALRFHSIDKDGNATTTFTISPDSNYIVNTPGKYLIHIPTSTNNAYDGIVSDSLVLDSQFLSAQSNIVSTFETIEYNRMCGQAVIRKSSTTTSTNITYIFAVDVPQYNSSVKYDYTPTINLGIDITIVRDSTYSTSYISSAELYVATDGQLTTGTYVTMGIGCQTTNTSPLTRTAFPIYNVNTVSNVTDYSTENNILAPIASPTELLSSYNEITILLPHTVTNMNTHALKLHIGMNETSTSSALNAVHTIEFKILYEYIQNSKYYITPSMV